MISNIKDLPTDNLYKFMAIFGMLLIILLFLVFPTIQNYKYRIIDLTPKAALKDIFKKIEIGKIESINLNNELKKVVADFNYFAILIYIIKVFPIIGFIISIIGFYLWYNKNQKYLDIIIKKESEK